MASRDPARPNVVFILSDDQGPWALGCAGNPEIHTPHLDGLAASGVRLSRFFCVSPVCSPARASLFTGRIPSAHGVHDWLSGPSPDDHLAGQRLFTDDLADAGYRLGLVGKWHLGANDVPRPGFVHWYAHPSGGGPYYGATMMGRQVDGYLTDALTAQAVAFIDQEAGRDEPFYLSLHYTAPHKPWKGQHPPEFEALYASCPFASCPQEAAHPWQPVGADGVPVGGEADVRAALIGYFAAVSAMDAGIGQVLATLAARGLTGSTLVVFTSDNGFNCGHHGIWGKGNGTFPQNMYDSSVMVPAIFSQPGRLPEGVVYDSLVSGYDLRPTLLDHLGLPDTGDGPGRSFAAFGDRSGAEVVVFDEYGPVRMIRTESWKYVHRHPHGPHELYHLEQDPDERHDLAHAGRPELAELRDRMDAWFSRHADPRLDGARLPVNGSGQHAPAGLGAFEPAPYRTEPR
ncbi:sulfatase-like hydrolase/transferase [Nonomuraea gerenzanensis]|uniref:Choline-sulfatase n=1 Tax=Nonomuraea gerenzanensis TaxID=93944 RepID=A0A1M4EB59_9ACTN|nr:sulfatase-like hydrolase/transferase [Nonomuraea gerenzanensis]UBU18359.1 sulfatase-like hydrolase/transferase [Nonomuraea gerenzanensis]SBO96187.1 Choline-sulfatase [Nonomuraea gerenzanensis]